MPPVSPNTENETTVPSKAENDEQMEQPPKSTDDTPTEAESSKVTETENSDVVIEVVLEADEVSDDEPEVLEFPVPVSNVIKTESNPVSVVDAQYIDSSSNSSQVSNTAPNTWN